MSLIKDFRAYCPETGPPDAGGWDFRVNRLRGGAAIESQHPA